MFFYQLFVKYKNNLILKCIYILENSNKILFKTFFLKGIS